MASGISCLAFCDCSFTQVFKQKLLERVSIVIQILHGSRAFTALPIIAGSPVCVYKFPTLQLAVSGWTNRSWMTLYAVNVHGLANVYRLQSFKYNTVAWMKLLQDEKIFFEILVQKNVEFVSSNFFVTQFNIGYIVQNCNQWVML